MMGHERFSELAGAYALGLLEADDCREFETHLMACEICRRELREFEQVAEGLGDMVQQHAPPAHLRGSVLAVARQERPAAPQTHTGSKAGKRVVPVPAWWLAAAAALFLAMAFYAVAQRARVSALRAELAAARETVLARDRQVDGLREVAESRRRVADVLAAADVSRVDLVGQAAAPRATGRAFWTPSRGIVFNASDLPALPPGKVYQLWVVTADAPLSVGLFEPDASGHASSVHAMPAGARPVAIAVTLEPAGGVPAPTGPMFLQGAV